MSAGWGGPPRTIRAERDVLHLWRSPLVLESNEVARLREWLNDDERARADRYVTDDLGRRFVAGRALLRGALGRYLDCDPRDVEFAYGEQGKPSLADTVAPLSFNLSHSGDVAVLGVTAERVIGIDVEFRRPSRDLVGIAERYFSPIEVATFNAVSDHARTESFYRGWTRKEAYLKAKGGGLSAPLDAFVVTLAPNEAPALVSSDLDTEEHPGWWMGEFDPGHGCTGAACVEGEAIELELWNWDRR